MPTTVSYSASMRTRKASSSSNAKSSSACQGYYDSSYNYVGIIHFAGMALSGKVITGIMLQVTASQAGYGAGSSKTACLHKANYQTVSQAGITGSGYCGDALGSFAGSFYGNTTNYTLSGDLFTNLAAYFSAGNNTICLYNPSPVKSSHGYSTDYMQWSECTISVTYEEAASKPSLSKTSFEMGTAVTVYTNRQSTAATHTLRYAYGTASGTIATDVTDSCSWTPPLTLASQIPNATSGWGILYCDTYVNGTLISTNTCTFTLTLPASIVPVISSVTIVEATAGIADTFGNYLRTKSKLAISISATGVQGSSISAYRTTLDGVSYTASAFTSNTLNTAGDLTLTVSVTDSRGRVATSTQTISVLDYAQPSLSLFTAERCSEDGASAQTDGTHVRISAKASVSSISGKNSMTCTVYYRLANAESWVEAATLTPDDYTVSATNLLLTPTFDALSSYDIKLCVQDALSTVEQTVSIGTKQVIMDFYRDGSGIAFGKVAETVNTLEISPSWEVYTHGPTLGAYAKAQAPVQSINGQTGDVVLEIPTGTASKPTVTTLNSSLNLSFTGSNESYTTLHLFTAEKAGLYLITFCYGGISAFSARAFLSMGDMNRVSVPLNIAYPEALLTRTVALKAGETVGCMIYTSAGGTYSYEYTRIQAIWLGEP